MKFCPKCKTEKAQEKFYKCRTRKDGLTCWCKSCSDMNGNNWLKKNPEKQQERREKSRLRGLLPHVKKQRRARALKHNYGLTETAYAALLAAQNNKCLVCGHLLRVVHVDHSHATGEVRGLLCAPCNWILGFAKDSPSLLRRAAEYLEIAKNKNKNKLK